MTGWLACGSWVVVVWAIGAVRKARIVTSRAVFAAGEALLQLSYKLDPNPPAIPTGGVDVAEEVSRLLAEMDGG